MCLSCAWSMVQEYERFRYVVFFFEKGPFHLLSFLSFMKNISSINQVRVGRQDQRHCLQSLASRFITLQLNGFLDSYLVQLFCGLPPSFSTSIRMRLLMRWSLRAAALISSWPLQFCTLDLWDVIANVLDWYVILFVSMKLWDRCGKLIDDLSKMCVYSVACAIEIRNKEGFLNEWINREVSNNNFKFNG